MIRENMTSVTVESHLGREVARGTISDKDVVLAELGIGMNNAAMTTQKMLDRYNPKAVIVSGIAGAIDSTVEIGDIVVCRLWSAHDYGYIGAEGFMARGTKVALPGVDSITRVSVFEVDDSLFATVELLTGEALDIGAIGDRQPRLRVGGAGVSGNTFIDSEEKRLWLNSEFGAMITDMESAAVAQVCAVNGVPFIAFRSASDLAGGSGSETARVEIEEFFAVAADNSSNVVLRFLEKL
jgi:adenosylhomocysteine nucleosidase